MTRQCFVAAFHLGVLSMAVMPSIGSAAISTISQPYQFIQSYSNNTIGATPGIYDAFGAFVTPNGSAGTTASASRNGVTVNVPFVGGSANPDEFSRSLSTSTTGGVTTPWLLTFTNNGDVRTVSTPGIANATIVPFARNVQISGAMLTPTFTWSIPQAVDDVRINIYDHNRSNTSGSGFDLVFSRDFAATTTSFTVPANLASGLALTVGHLYTLEVGLIDTRSGGMPTSQSDVLSRSRTFADFTPLAVAPGNGVFLPIVTPGVNGGPPVFSFDVAGVDTTTRYYDPEVAVGYDYAIGAGDPNFKSVLLPTGIGDGIYDVTVGGVTTSVAGGVSFEFASGGARTFRVTGIEPAAGLDPLDATAFVTGLAFVSSGQFTGTMTPLTIDIMTAVPEPSTYALMLGGLGLLGWMARRGRVVA